MTISNRRVFFKKAAVGGAGAALAATDLMNRRIFAQGKTEFNRVVYRELGSTGFKASEVGFGAMNMRDPELVHAAIDKGINYIDTAWWYMKGANEECIGTVMKTKRDKVFLTTKIFPRKPDDMMSMMETSLKRLQTDHTDLILLHAVSSRKTALSDEYIKVMDEARKKGMCRFLGMSAHTNNAEVLDAAVESKFWQAVLVGYNFTSPQTVTDSIAKARQAGIAVIAMKTFLTSTWPPSPLPDPPADTSGKTTKIQTMLKWVLNNPYVDTTVLGMTAFEHLEEDMAVMGMKMGFEDRRILRRLGEGIRGKYCRGVAGCTGCQNQCPMGVQICEINRCLGYAYGYGDLRLARENYARLPASNRVDKCGDCEECQVKCVNGLNLSHSIRKAKELFA